MIDFGKAFKSAEEAIDESGEKYAQAKSARYLCERNEKHVWCKAYLKYKNGLSIKDAEARAYTDTEFLEQVELTARAIENEINAKKKYEIALAKQEAYRSLCSQETAKIKML